VTVLDALTPRERQVVTRLISGQTLLQVSRELHIGLTTAKTHLDKAHVKLGVTNRADLCRVVFESETREMKAQNVKFRKALELLAVFPGIPGSTARTALR
jgi:DNA-binding CsgD family transcriptional regulator